MEYKYKELVKRITTRYNDIPWGERHPDIKDLLDVIRHLDAQCKENVRWGGDQIAKLKAKLVRQQEAHRLDRQEIERENAALWLEQYDQAVAWKAAALAQEGGNTDIYEHRLLEAARARKLEG